MPSGIPVTFCPFLFEILTMCNEKISLANEKFALSGLKTGMVFGLMSGV